MRVFFICLRRPQADSCCQIGPISLIASTRWISTRIKESWGRSGSLLGFWLFYQTHKETRIVPLCTRRRKTVYEDMIENIWSREGKKKGVSARSFCTSCLGVFSLAPARRPHHRRWTSKTTSSSWDVYLFPSQSAKKNNRFLSPSQHPKLTSYRQYPRVHSESSH